MALYMDVGKLKQANGLHVLICSREGVKDLKWAVAITLTQLEADLREAERVESSGSITRTKQLISTYKQISTQLAEILKD